MRLDSCSSFDRSSFRIACLNVLLTFFVLTSLFGLLRAVNSMLSSVRVSPFFLVSKYCLRYLMASYPMKDGCFCRDMLILHGFAVSGSKIRSTSFILSFFMMCGFSPDCLMTVKNAFSLIGTEYSCAIELISPFSISLSLMNF